MKIEERRNKIREIEEIIICTCLVCNYKWVYESNVNESIIRATCAPCGHQGLFRVERKKEEVGK